MSVTIWEVAKARGVQEDERGGVNAGEFHRVGLPFLGGCERCGATIGPAQAMPSRSGYLRDEQCIGDLGFDTVEAFEVWAKADEDELAGAL